MLEATVRTCLLCAEQKWGTCFSSGVSIVQPQVTSLDDFRGTEKGHAGARVSIVQVATLDDFRGTECLR